MEYRLNTSTNTAHYANFSTEECNLDDADGIEDSDILPDGYGICEHCEERRIKALKEIADSEAERI